MKNMKFIRNDSGVALMMVLFIATIGLSVMATMLYMVMISSQSSGMHKRFATALDAGVGGDNVMVNYINNRGNISKYTDYISSLNLAVELSDSCVKQKLTEDTKDWAPACDKGRVIDINDKSTYDMVFNLGNYEIYTKIIHTKKGNTGGSGEALWAGGGVTHVIAPGSEGSGTGNINTTPIPYLYTVVIESRNKAYDTTTDRSARDKARLYMLYEY